MQYFIINELAQKPCGLVQWQYVLYLTTNVNTEKN